MADVAIRTDDLTRDFKSVRAVDRLTLDVPSGVVFGFLGPNGSGKTTTIRLLLGLIAPTDGRAEVLGIDTRRDPHAVRARCGALLEHAGLYERLNAEENLEFVARAWRLRPADRRARIRALLEGIGLWDRRHETVATWSRGMKQKLAVARTLVHRPALVFLDEPTAGLDPIASAALRDDLARLAVEEGVTVFLTTHNLPEAEKLCARIAVVRNGRLLAVAEPEALRERMGGGRLEVVGRGIGAELVATLRAQPGVLHASIATDDGRSEAAARGEAARRGEAAARLAAAPAEAATLTLVLAGATPTPPIVRLLVEHGVEIEQVRRGAADLEEAFMTLMDSAEGRVGPGPVEQREAAPSTPARSPAPSQAAADVAPEASAEAPEATA